ncbi:hypothetical protein HOP50_04g34090 [Chloropicon primus]|uniref:CUE domain-containing protein n=2 Tax=Chloropicon primus TaxID=1764295 RepID=A0A5B8MNG6_9CHLO|nr:hypothetical protein A3770_04p34000 [Chloropicon primus]UPR00095.1 hypothetical protein HOP50_04g34090 [Chloropicon primus]|eukprot:QDZ20882.1 hypothetical protein A3770_04p34000 [Chloropicon primus]
MVSGEARGLVEEYLSGSGANAVDGDAVDYLLGLVSTLDATDAEGVQECCGVFVEYKSELAGGSGAGEMEEAERAIEGVKAALRGKDAAENAPNEERDLLNSMKSLLSKVHTFTERQDENGDEGPPPGLPDRKGNHVSVLRGIIEAASEGKGGKEVSDATIEMILDECNGDLGEAALWITENDVWTYQSHLLKKDKEREEAIADSKANNSKIFERYGLRPVSTNSADLSLARRGGKSSKDKDKGPKVRYHEGQVVTSRGEKYITVKDEKEEWDGGSRGKVITKGKRGKGFT